MLMDEVESLFDFATSIAFGAYGSLAHPQNGKIEERTSQIGVMGTESIEREAGEAWGELRPAFSSLLC